MISDNEVSDVLKSWNPMGKSKATMKPETHRSQQTPQQERGKDPYLVFKNVPRSLNVEILTSLCSAYGRVLRARQHEQFNMFFVNFATLSDLWNALEGLKDNTFGMTIELGKTVPSQPIKQNPAGENQGDSERMEQRTVPYQDDQQKPEDKIANNLYEDFCGRIS